MGTFISLEKNPSAYFHCPTCFLVWHEKTYGVVISGTQSHKTCDYCSSERTPLETLRRQIDILDRAYASDLPKVIKNLVKHLELKE